MTLAADLRMLAFNPERAAPKAAAMDRPATRAPSACRTFVTAACLSRTPFQSCPEPRFRLFDGVQHAFHSQKPEEADFECPRSDRWPLDGMRVT